MYLAMQPRRARQSPVDPGARRRARQVARPRI